MPPSADVFPMADTASWSPLQRLRAQYTPELPPALHSAGVEVQLCSETVPANSADRAAVQRTYPHIYGLPLISLAPTDKPAAPGPAMRVGVLFHGRQSPGGHNVVAGIFDSLAHLNPGSTLLGFPDGSGGLSENKPLQLTADVIDLYRNQGGYDMLGRSKGETLSQQQLEAAKGTCEALKLDGLVLIGGSATATDVGKLAEYFAATKVATKVVAVPCTIDNDLKGPFIPVTAGFDTASRVFSEYISNICTDALSAEKYYFFIRLMGRRSSHLAVESMLRTQANMVIVGEEVLPSRLTLQDITNRICDAICERSAQKGKHHGVVIFPEGLIEHISEVHALLEEVEGLRREGVTEAKPLEERLSPWSRAVLAFLPASVKEELLLHRTPVGTIRFSKIETEKLFLTLVEAEMERRTKAGLYKGKKFNGITYFFGYQARGSLPSNFDCSYAYALGRTACRLVASSASGYIATISGLQSDISKWQPGGVPVTALMTINRWLAGSEASIKGVPLVNPARVDIKGKAFLHLQENAGKWLMEDLYRNSGPLQFEGAGADSRPATLAIEGSDYFAHLAALQAHLDNVRELVRPGCAPEVLNAAVAAVGGLQDVLAALTSQPGL